jgi:WhiB family redox-sensing transcriptional regulator
MSSRVRPEAFAASKEGDVKNPEFSWVRLGACVGMAPEIWFPGHSEHGGEAKAVCAGCEVKKPCLELALKEGFQGIWGGTSERERKQIRRRRALARRKQNVA